MIVFVLLALLLVNGIPLRYTRDKWLDDNDAMTPEDEQNDLRDPTQNFDCKHQDSVNLIGTALMCCVSQTKCLVAGSIQGRCSIR
jgi:hypothetical protein